MTVGVSVNVVPLIVKLDEELDESDVVRGIEFLSVASI